MKLGPYARPIIDTLFKLKLFSNNFQTTVLTFAKTRSNVNGSPTTFRLQPASSSTNAKLWTKAALSASADKDPATNDQLRVSLFYGKHL